MKTIITYLLLLSSTILFSQQVNLSVDFDSLYQSQLLPFPNDSQKYICVQEVAFETNLLTVENSITTPLVFPLITNIRNPLFYKEKIIFTGTSLNTGVEIYLFDGVNTTIIDIEEGINSSNPFAAILNDQLYIIAKKGDYSQLFKMKDDFTLEQITDELTENVSQCIYEINDKIYYSTNASTDILYDPISTIKQKDILTGIISVIDLNVAPYYGSFFFNNHLYLTTTIADSIDPTLVHSSAFIINDDLSSLEIVATPNYPNWTSQSIGLFEFENSLFYSKYNDNVVYKSTDGITFNVFCTLPDNNHFREVKLVDNKRFFILTTMDLNTYFESFVIKSLTSSGFEDVFTYPNSHGHFLTGKDNYQYFVYEDYSNLKGYLLELDILANTTNSSIITDSAIHPPYSWGQLNGAVWIGNSFSFLFGNSLNSQSFDIYSFDTDLGIDYLGENIFTFNMFPNPTNNGKLTIKSSEVGILTITGMDGRILQTSKIESGINDININELSAGSYLVSHNGITKTLIVN